MSLEIGATFSKELQTLRTPQSDTPALPVPGEGDKAPSSDRISFPQPKPTLIVFLRHCGCPFAEKTFKDLTLFSTRHPEIRCIAVSHCSQEVTDRWIIESGGQWDVEVLVDEKRELYNLWGVGLSNVWHIMNPWAAYSAYRLGKEEGIWTHSLGSGTKWQKSAAFAVDPVGFVRWVKVANHADDLPKYSEAAKALKPGRAESS